MCGTFRYDNACRQYHRGLLRGDIDYRYDPDTADVQVIARSALPEYESDERKRYAVSGVIQGYCMQLADMLEDYYDYLDVSETEEEPQPIG